MGKQRVAISLLLFAICSAAFAQEKAMTFTGKLMHVMAIGGESTGWAIQLDSPVTLEGKELNSLEVSTGKMSKLRLLANQHVTATGTISHRTGVERGERIILNLASIAEVRGETSKTSSQSGTPDTAIDLTNTRWLLEDLAGSGVIDNVQATLEFAQAKKVSGNASCNRFFGTVEVTQNDMKFGALGSTRKACPPAVMNQEAKYLEALGAVKHFEWKPPFLLLSAGADGHPLRFTRLSEKNGSK